MAAVIYIVEMALEGLLSLIPTVGDPCPLDTCSCHQLLDKAGVAALAIDASVSQNTA